MQMPLQIAFKNMEPSPAVEQRIRDKAATLERFSDRITGCRVVISAPHRHQHKGQLYRISLDITVPPKSEIAISREHRQDHAHEDIYVAIRDAFDAAVRRLEDHTRKVRGQIKTHEMPMHGRVVRMFPDHGFVESSDGQSFYFHRNSVPNGRFDSLEPGAEVRLAIADQSGDQGPQASAVVPVGKHHPVG